MSTDMKEAIAEAAQTLLVQRHVKKLTVKDIVEECHITRQTFYYHFEDIPGLFRWMLERDTERTRAEAKALGDGEARLRYFFIMALNALPYVKRGMESNYRDELGRLLTRYVQSLFAQVCDEEGLYRDCTRFETELILRYHSQAVMGLLWNWSEADTRDLDQIVHTVFRLITEGISPGEKAKA